MVDVGWRLPVISDSRPVGRDSGAVRCWGAFRPAAAHL